MSGNGGRRGPFIAGALVHRGAVCTASMADSSAAIGRSGGAGMPRESSTCGRKVLERARARERALKLNFHGGAPVSARCSTKCRHQEKNLGHDYGGHCSTLALLG